MAFREESALEEPRAVVLRNDARHVYSFGYHHVSVIDIHESVEEYTCHNYVKGGDDFCIPGVLVPPGEPNISSGLPSLTKITGEA